MVLFTISFLILLFLPFFLLVPGVAQVGPKHGLAPARTLLRRLWRRQTRANHYPRPPPRLEIGLMHHLLHLLHVMDLTLWIVGPQDVKPSVA